MRYNHIIDGDVIVYTAAWAAQNQNERLAKTILTNTIKTIRDNIHSRFNVGDETFFITSNDKTNFRYQIAKTKPYKGNRLSKSRPIYYDLFRQILVDNWDAVEVQGQEADDAMGILASRDPEFSIISSIDKDMAMVNCWHDKMDPNLKSFYAQDPGYLQLLGGKRGKGDANIVMSGGGVKFFWAQMLTGDDADNIPGIKLKGPEFDNIGKARGIGAKMAVELLKNAKTESEMQDIVVNEYLERGYTEERILEIGQLLWIRRKEGEQWQLK